MKFPIKDFFSKCDQIHSILRIWLHLMKKSLIENFIFCAVWSKLNFGPFRGQSCHLPELDRRLRRHYFYLFIQFLRKIGRKWLGQTFWISIWVYNYLLKGIRLELGLDNCCWLPKYLTLLQAILTFGRTKADLGKSNFLMLIVLQTA